MNKKNRWAAIVGVVCGAELVAAAIIGGAGIAALASIEAAIVVALVGTASIWIVLAQRRGTSTSNTSSLGTTDSNTPEPIALRRDSHKAPDPTEVPSRN